MSKDKRQSDSSKDSGSRRRSGSFFEELQKRKVIRAAIAYVVGAWVLLQVAELVFNALDYKPWVLTITFIALVAGFPVAVVVAWIYELTPHGMEVDQGDHPPTKRRGSLQKAVDLLLIAVLIGGVAWFTISSVPDLLDRERQAEQGDVEDSFAGFDLNSIAVLPFANDSSDADAGYFGDGLADEIITVLHRLPEFKVTTRHVSFKFRSGDPDLNFTDIARTMKVRYILGGSVRRAGNKVRVTARLTDAESEKYLWEEQFDRDFDEIFDIQSEIANAVADASKTILSANSQNSLLHRPTNSVEAYDFYLQGRDYLRRPRTVPNLDAATTLFNRALSLDEEYALAYAGLCWSNLHLYQLTKSTDTVDDAEQACEQALTFDEGLSEVHAALGELYRQTGDLDAAETQFRISLKMDPRSFEGVEGLAMTLIGQNELESAEVMLRKMIDLQKGYWRGYAEMGKYLYRHGKDEEAIPFFKQVTELAPDNALGWNNLGAAHYVLGNTRGAATAWQKALEIAPSQSMYINLGSMYYYLGQYDKSAEMQQKAIETAPDDYRIWGRLAAAYAQQPDKDAEALATYERAIALAEEALEVNPNHPDVLKNVSLFYAHAGRAEDALEATATSLQLTPKDPDTHFFASLVYQELGETDDCINSLAKAIDLGYMVELIRQEPALAPIRELDQFQILVMPYIN